MSVKLAFGGFWPGFDENDNFFKKALDEYFGDEKIEIVPEHDNPDIIVCSVFGEVLSKNKNTRRIFFTGESRKDFLKFGDIFLGFDETCTGRQIYRLPLWMLYIDWWKTPNEMTSLGCTKEDLNRLCTRTTDEEILKTISRSNTCAIISSNPEATNRVEVAKYLRSVFDVHGYGIALTGKSYEQSKIELLQNYLFNICFENSIHKGYVTEKLFEAKFSGCIPIYWGDEWCKKDFNERCFIYYNNYENTDSFIEHVKKIYSSKQALEELISEPLFTEKPSLEGLYTFFDDVRLKG